VGAKYWAQTSVEPVASMVVVEEREESH